MPTPSPKATLAPLPKVQALLMLRVLEPSEESVPALGARVPVPTGPWVGGVPVLLAPNRKAPMLKVVPPL